jgi:hypothetical protein
MRKKNSYLTYTCFVVDQTSIMNKKSLESILFCQEANIKSLLFANKKALDGPY